MNELDYMKANWTSQSVPHWSGEVSLGTLSQLQEQMKHFEREHAPRHYLFMALASGLISLLGFLAVWTGRDTDSLWIALIFLIGSGIAGAQYYTGRNVPHFDDDLEAFLLHTQRRLKWRRRILPAGLLGMGVVVAGLLWDNPGEWAQMGMKEKVGLGAVILIYGGLMGIVMWWQKHHGPYKVNEMETLVNNLLRELQHP